MSDINSEGRPKMPGGVYKPRPIIHKGRPLDPYNPGKIVRQPDGNTALVGRFMFGYTENRPIPEPVKLTAEEALPLMRSKSEPVRTVAKMFGLFSQYSNVEGAPNAPLLEENLANIQ